MLRKSKTDPSKYLFTSSFNNVDESYSDGDNIIINIIIVVIDGITLVALVFHW